MALQKQNLSLVLTQGINTKIDDKQAQTGTIEVLENVVFDEPGKYKKRTGFDKLDVTLLDGSVISDPQKLTTFNDELCIYNKTNFYSYSQSTAKWTDKGTVSNIFPQNTSVVRNSYKQFNIDSNHVESLNIFAWEDSRGGIRISVIDNNTGNELISDFSISATGIKPKVEYIANKAYIIYIDGTNLKYRSLKSNNPNQLSAETTLASDIHASVKLFDSSSFINRIYLAYKDTAGGVRFFYIDETETLSAIGSDAGETPTTCIYVGYDSMNRMIIAYYNGTAVKYFVRNSSLSVNIVNPTVIETVSNVVNVLKFSDDGATYTWLYEISQTETYNHFIKTNTTTVSGSVGTASVFIRSCGLMSKDFKFENNPYTIVLYESPLQASLFILNSDAEVVCKISPTLSGELRTSGNLSNVSILATTQFLFASQIKGKTVSEQNTLFSILGVNSTKLEFNLDVKYDNAPLGFNLHTTGGMIQSYDGKEIVEHGFHLFPEPLTEGATATTGGFMSDGEYQYTAIYSWIDNKGQEHKSAPSVPIIVTLSAGTTTQTQEIEVPTLRITEKSNVVIDLYRTEGTGTVFYKVTSSLAPIYNDTTVDSITIEDTLADLTILSNEVLYTTSGELENIAPPAASIIEAFQNRIFLAGLEDENKIQYSKIRTDGKPVEFNDTLTINVNPIGGAIKGLGVLDDKLIIFKETGIYYLSGAGPNNSGEQDDFIIPELISSDVGCKTQNSVVLMPNGLMFQSEKGIYVVDKSLGTSYIGAPVEAFNDLTITDARFIPTKNQVIFISNGDALVYNYYVEQWSTNTNHQGISSTVLNNDYYYVRENNEVYINSTGYTDNGSFIQMKLETAWISFAGVQGFQRVYRLLILGEYKNPHKLTTEIGYNFIEAFTQSKTVDSSDFATTSIYGETSTTYGSESPYGGTGNQYQFRLDLEKQKCQSIKIRIFDTQDSDFSEGVQLSNILMVVGAKRSEFKPNQARIYGTRS